MVMCLLHIGHMCSFFLKFVNKLFYPRSLRSPAAREKEVLISKVNQGIKRWKFHLLQPFGLFCVFSRLCLSATEASTSCTLHLNQAL